MENKNTTYTLYLSVGGCGNNMLHALTKHTQLIADPRLQTVYVNFAETDFSDRFKGICHLVESGGTGRDPKLGKTIVEKNIKQLEELFGSFNDPDIERVVLLSSLGGGTGSSLIPIVIDTLGKKKPITLIGVLPSNKEGVSTLPNAIKTYRYLYNNYILTSKLKSFYILDNEKFIKEGELSLADYDSINERMVKYIESFLDESHCYKQSGGYSTLDLNERRRVQNWGGGVLDFVMEDFSCNEILDEYKCTSSVFSGRYKWGTAKAVSVQLLFKNMERTVKPEHIEFGKQLVSRIKSQFKNSFFVFGFVFQNEIDKPLQMRMMINGLDTSSLFLSNAKKAAKAVERLKEEHDAFDLGDLDLEF